MPTDTERLDWLAAHPWAIGPYLADGATGLAQAWRIYGQFPRIVGYTELRDAIDAAIAAERGEEDGK